MRVLKGMIALLASVLFAGCGGGGGDAGASPFDPGSGDESSTTYTISVEVRRAGVATTQISSSETVQAVATVTTSGGSPVEGVVISFGEQGASLLALSPASGTALTDSSGTARIDLSAGSSAQTGASTVVATATVASDSISASRSIQITAGGDSGGTPATPAAINFIGSSPSGTAIVIKGAGGSGRSESAILTFRVVDAANAPINGAVVDFTINANSGGASITPATAATNSDGQVTVTVSSGSSPASVVVTATSDSVPSVSTQSDTLIVSNDVVLPAGFEIVAEKYNLDGRLTGDSTSITAFVRDQFGNPVADGVAVSFTTDYGAVASATLGGCTTINGTCDVEFRVQNPRGDGLATVIGTVRVGDETTVANSLQINMAGATGTPYLAVDDNGDVVTELTMNGACKKTFELYLSDGNGRAPAMSTTIAAPSTSTGVGVEVKTGSPVLDQLGDGFPPALFSFEVDLTSADLVPACDATAGSGSQPAEAVFFRLEYTTPNNLVFSQRIELAYPH